jgi:hypothetical protein
MTSRNSLFKTPGDNPEGPRAAGGRGGLPKRLPHDNGLPWNLLVSLQMSLRGSYKSSKAAFQKQSYFVLDIHRCNVFLVLILSERSEVKIMVLLVNVLMNFWKLILV